MRLKGLRKLNHQFTKFVKTIEPELSAEMGIEFDYVFTKNLVHYSLAIPQSQNDLWEEFLKDTFNFDLGENVFLLSLLHEIGHHETMEDLTEFWDIDSLEKEVIQYKVNNNLEGKKPYFDYFNLPLEYAATEWAINYYNSNKQKLDKAFSILINNIRHFYKRNNIEY